MRHSHSRRLALLGTPRARPRAGRLWRVEQHEQPEHLRRGGGGSSKPAVHVTKDAALAAKVPPAIASDGKITVGTDATYAPNEFLARTARPSSASTSTCSTRWPPSWG